MRSLELTLTAVLALHLLVSALLSRRKTSIPGYIALMVAPIGLGQLLIEGYRWQMLPLYAYTAILSVLAIHRLRKRKPPAKHPATLKQMWRMLGAGLALVLALLLPNLLAVPQFPAPTGPYPVGTTTFELIKPDRAEIYGDKPGQPRALVVQIWYPAETMKSSDKAPWMEHIENQLSFIAESGGLPEFMFSHLIHTRTHSYLNPPLSEAEVTYPVLHFSHGYGGWRSGYTFLLEELASHGYVIVSTEHTYAALNTIFSDGSSAPLDPTTLPDDVPDDVYDAAAKRLLEQWVADTVAVQTHLAENQLAGRAGQFNDRLDFERMAMLGHSTGGGGAIQFCANSDDCRFVVGLDPWLAPVSNAVVASGITQPGLFLFSDPEMAYFEPKNRQRFDLFRSNARGPICDLQITGTGHHDFDDTGTFSPVARFLGYSKGPIPINRAFKIINTYTLAFLDQQFKDTPTDLLNGPSDWFPEVSLDCSLSNR